MKIETYQAGDPEHQDSIWYDGDIAFLSEGNREVMVIAVGDIRIYDQEGIVFDGKQRGNGIEGSFEKDKDLKKIGNDYDDRYYWDANNWFNILFRKKGSDTWDVIMDNVHHEYDCAMEGAKIMLKDDEFWNKIEVEK